MVEREFKVMSAIKSQGVPVPNCLHLCEDSSVIGTPFYVMDLVQGDIYQEPNLATQTPKMRNDLYNVMCETLAKIHSVDLHAADLFSYGRQENYLDRQLHRWIKQYEASKTSTIDSFDNLAKWLPANVPPQLRSTLVHGDYRLDNLIFYPNRTEVAAVLDWELSTLGDPLTDLATCCLPYYLPSTFPHLKGFADTDLPAGIPTAQEFVQRYCSLTGVEISASQWSFYIAFVCFRFAAILQGVYKRALQGQASAPNAKNIGLFVKAMADVGWRQANASPGVTRFAGDTNAPGDVIGRIMTSPDAMSPRAKDFYDRVKRFVESEILPIEQSLADHFTSVAAFTPNEQLEKLKAKAKREGLWNLFVPKKIDTSPKKYGAGLTNEEYAHICELMGKSVFAPEVFNCSAPDTGNMEVFIHYGTEAQKQKWLVPLLNGETRSCFAMTEPEVASSDATNIQSSIRADGNEYVLNGRKWYISGAMHPKCEVCIFMGKTDPSAERHSQQSMVIVPMNTPGVKVVRPMRAVGFLDAPGCHPEILFENVRVPKSNIILGEGRGFDVAQGRLGPGRIHHCMRLIGHAERALELMGQRVVKRTAFGKPLAAQGSIQQDMAKSRIDIEQCRLLVLKAAHMMDTVGNKVAAPEIAMIKVAVPNMALRVIDRAIQAHGAMGVSQDTPLAMMFVWARVLRIADGPDQVHLRALARHELKRYSKL